MLESMAQPLPNFASFLRTPGPSSSSGSTPTNGSQQGKDSGAPGSGSSTPTEHNSPGEASAVTNISMAASTATGLGKGVSTLAEKAGCLGSPAKTTPRVADDPAKDVDPVSRKRRLDSTSDESDKKFLKQGFKEQRTGSAPSIPLRQGAIMSAKRATMGELLEPKRERSSSIGTKEDKPRVTLSTTSTPKASTGASASASTTSTPPTRERTSRYLSEGDRREIISRIDRGEKQVALAKEYCVSRAAICNLYKNRQEVLTRADRDPDAKHPKKQRKKATQGASASSPSLAPSSAAVTKVKRMGGDDTDQSGTEARGDRSMSPMRSRRRLIECGSRSKAVKQLITVLRDRRTNPTDYRHCADRVMRLVLEETLSCLPARLIDVCTEQGNVCSNLPAPWSEDVICALSMEQKGLAMLTQFSNLQRRSPTGTVTVWGDKGNDSTNNQVIINAPPPVFKACKVFLILDTCFSSGKGTLSVVEELVKSRGVPISSIYLVTLVAAHSQLDQIQNKYSDVNIVCAAVDPVVDNQGNITPGIGSFTDRYWNAKDSPSADPLLQS